MVSFMRMATKLFRLKPTWIYCDCSLYSRLGLFLGMSIEKRFDGRLRVVIGVGPFLVELLFSYDPPVKWAERELERTKRRIAQDDAFRERHPYIQ